MTKGTTRIGDVVAGMVKQSDDHEEKNDPTPIVLWSAQGQPAAILYYSSETDAANRSGVQKISRIPTKGGARVGKAGSWFGDFPVKVKLRETDEKGAPPPDPIELRSIVNADIDGDGIDELVFARRLGGVSVYSAEKLLFQHKHQEIKPDQYNYEFLVPFKVGLEKADVLFVVVNRSLAVPESDLPPGEKAFHEKTEAYLLLMLDASGITPVRLQNPAWKIGRVAGVGAVSGREDRIEELVAFIEKEGESQLYLSRHRPDGSAIAPPRKVYVPGPNFPTLETLFVPGASRVVMADRANAQIYFTAREKAANWFRVVDLKKKLPGNEPIVPLRAVRNGAATLALVRQGKQVYALDEEGQFYGGMGKVLSLVQGRKPCLSFGSGDDYELVNVVAPEKVGDHLLVVETRKPGTRILSDAELTEAGKKFLSPAVYAMAERAGKIWFHKRLQLDAQETAKKNGITRRIESLEDIRKFLPEYYESLRAESRFRFLKDLEGSLFLPISMADKRKAIEEYGYRRKDEYVAWLRGAHREGEVVLTAFNIGGKLLGKVTLAGYFYPWTDTALWLDRVNYRGRGDHGVAVMTLTRKTFAEDTGAGYYRIDW